MISLPLFSFFTAALGLGFLLRSGLAGRMAMDMPNHRSLHAAPIPRIGGLVIVPAFLLVWLMSWGSSILLSVVVALLAIFSYLDDRSDLSAAFRLAIHLVAAAAFVLLELDLQSALAAIGAVLWIGWCTNLYNFMDGADGLAGGMAVFGFAAYGLAAAFAGEQTLSVACFSVAAAAAGFLLFNFPPAKTFMGDTGSISLGFLVGAIGLLGWHVQAWPIWFPVIVFSPFLLDATVTLLNRAFRAERIWEAHRDHYYQRLVRMGWSHRRLALIEYVIMAACAASALLLLKVGSELQVVGLLAWAVIYAAAMIRIDLCWKKFSATPV